MLAAAQAAAYVAELQSRGKDAELFDFTLPGNPSLGARSGTVYTDAFRVVLQECGGATINYRVWRQYQTTSTGPGVVMVDGHLEEEPCSATPVPTTSSSSTTTAPPTDEEQPQNWGECMMDAGRLAVNAGDWVGRKAGEVQLPWSLRRCGRSRR